MSAQTIKEVTRQEAQALISTPGTKKIALATYGIPSRGITVTVRPGRSANTVRLIIVKGCACD